MIVAGYIRTNFMNYLSCMSKYYRAQKLSKLLNILFDYNIQQGVNE